MAIPVLVLGESGTGKSCSLRNFKADEIFLINVMSKPLPFKTDIKPFNLNKTMTTSSGQELNAYDKIKAVFAKFNSGETEKKVIVIDDAQYLMVNEMMEKSHEQGYQKWTDMAKHFFDVLTDIRVKLPDDVIVYILAHTETDTNGKEKFKTVGKLMDNYSIEGVCTVCLKTVVDNGYWFATQNNGYDTTKSPIGMFESEKIDNDLKAVDVAIRDYYGIKTNKTKKSNKKEG